MTIDKIEEYFKSVDLPATIQLNEYTFLSDVRKNVDSNISYLRANPGNKRFMPYYNQLVELAMLIESEKNM